MKKLIFAIFILTFFAKFSYSQTMDFDLNDINGNSVKLSQLLEKGPVMISFWATWCVPCKEEMKVMNEIYKTYKDSGFIYVAINTDDTKSSAKVKPYIETKGYNFPVLMDNDKSVFEKFGGQSIPFALLLTRSGDIHKTYSTGYTAGDEKILEQDIKEVLATKK